MSQLDVDMLIHIFNILNPKLLIKKGEQTDIETYLNKTLVSSVANNPTKELKDVIININNLRNLIINSNNNISKQIECISEYFFILKFLRNFSNAYSPNLYTNVIWYDSMNKSVFGVNKKYSYSQIDFEIINILYLLSYNINNSMDKLNFQIIDDLKTFIKNHQLLSSIFEEIKNITPLLASIELPIDCSSEHANIWKNISIANAQFGFYIQSLKSGSTKIPQLLKIIRYSQICYKVAYDLIINLDRVQDKNLENKIYSIYMFFTSLVHLYQSYNDENESKYNYKLTNIKMAFESAQYFCKISQSQDILAFINIIKYNYNKAQKENELIYHASLVDQSKLTFPQPLVIAKNIELNYDNFNIKSAILDQLTQIPSPLLINTIKSYEIAHKEYISNILDQCTKSNDIIDELFSSIGLPQILSSSTDVPDEIKQKIHFLQNEGKITLFEHNLLLLDSSYHKSINSIQKMYDKLKDESDNDKYYREKYLKKWCRISSQEASRSLRENLLNCEKYLVLSLKSDNSIRDKFDNIKSSLLYLSNCEKNALFNSTNNIRQCINEKNRNQISELYNNLIKIKSNRQNLINKLEYKESDIKLHFSKIIQSTNIFDSSLEIKNILSKLDDTIKNIHDTFNQQSVFIDQLLKFNDNLNQPTQNQINSNQLFHHYNEYLKLFEGLNRGLKFYKDLESNLFEQFSLVNGFIKTRIDEAGELEKRIQSFQYSNNSNINYTDSSMNTNQQYQYYNYQNHGQNPNLPR